MWPWYFILDVVLWGIALGLTLWAWPKLNRYWKVSVFWTIGIVMVLQVGNELLSLHVFKAWEFSLEHNRLLGLDLWGAPVEEYLFWFAFAWGIPFLYSGLACRSGTAAEVRGDPHA